MEGEPERYVPLPAVVPVILVVSCDALFVLADTKLIFQGQSRETTRRNYLREQRWPMFRENSPSIFNRCKLLSKLLPSQHHEGTIWDIYQSNRYNVTIEQYLRRDFGWNLNHVKEGGCKSYCTWTTVKTRYIVTLLIYMPHIIHVLYAYILHCIFVAPWYW